MFEYFGNLFVYVVYFLYIVYVFKLFGSDNVGEYRCLMVWIDDEKKIKEW